MSFGYSIGDAIVLSQLAWKTVQNARKACGEHNELTQEVLSLHVVLRRLEHEVEKPENPLNGSRSGEPDKEELQVIVNGCQRVLRVLDQILTKYNALSEQERSGRRLWQKIKFGNGKMADLAEMRGKLTYYTSAMSLFLNMVSMGTMGRVERQMNDTGGDLKEIKVAVNGITAHLMSSSNRHEGSILTAYAGDDRAVWKEFRRELLEDGFSSSVIRKHKRLIKAYIEELGSRGLLDDEGRTNDAEEQCSDVDPVVEGAMAYNPEMENSLEASSEIVSEIVSAVESEAESEVESEAESELEPVVKLPVEPTPRPDLDTEPKTAFHLETGPLDKERPVDDSIPELDSKPKPKAEMRAIRSRKESGGGSQQNPRRKAEDYPRSYDSRTGRRSDPSRRKSQENARWKPGEDYRDDYPFSYRPHGMERRSDSSDRKIQENARWKPGEDYRDDYPFSHRPRISQPILPSKDLPDPRRSASTEVGTSRAGSGCVGQGQAADDGRLRNQGLKGTYVL